MRLVVVELKGCGMLRIRLVGAVSSSLNDSRSLSIVGEQLDCLKSVISVGDWLMLAW